MDTKYIQEFCTLAETGNFTEAAEKLYISQSTLSRHIRNFEAELGIDLFTRNGKSISINDYGRRFLPYAKKILAVQDECQQKYFEELRKLNDNLTVGLFTMDPYRHFANLAFEFKENHPDYNIVFIEEQSDSLRNLLQDGNCDLAVILSENKQDEVFGSCNIAVDHLSAIFPANHILANRSSVPFHKLQKERFIIQTGESAEAVLCLRAARSAGFEPDISRMTLSTKSLIRHVERGHGITLKPKSFSVGRNRQIAVIDLEPEYEIYVNIIYRKDVPLTALGKQFIKFLCSAQEPGFTNKQDE